MFAQSLIHWRNRVLGQARAAGELQGMRTMILRQLKRRFGPLPSGVPRRVAAIASRQKLETLADRVLVANSLEELGLS